MFYDNELRFLQKMLTKCHVPSQVVDPTAPLAESLGQGIRQLFSYKEQNKNFYDFVPDVRSATVYRMVDMFLCRYIFLELPFCDTPSVFVVGPYLSAVPSRQQILELLERFSLPPRMSRDWELFYGSLPAVREEHHLFAMVNTFAEYIFSGEDNFDSADLHFEHRGAFLPERSALKPAAEAEGLDAQVMEERYKFENDLMEAVSQGNSHRAELMLASFSPLAFEMRTSDPLRNAKNYCIIMNTLMRKAAEKGRVHPVQLDRVSSDFAFRIESLRSLGDLPALMTELIHTYCRLVKRHSMRNYSPLVQKALIYIEGDLTGDLSLRSVARRNNVSPGYLSGLFKKETGQTFTGYVNGRRIAQAKRLLKSTNLQIQTIAQHCGILDFHYFCRLFKSLVGKTPTEYRNGYVID